MILHQNIKQLQSCLKNKVIASLHLPFCVVIEIFETVCLDFIHELRVKPVHVYVCLKTFVEVNPQEANLNE